jgi:hypothetical protein
VARKDRRTHSKAKPPIPPPADPAPRFLRPWMVIVVAALLLLVFLGKAMTIDDPLFIWTAQQLQQHPLDPYGYMGNWFSLWAPMTDNIQNPPLASYWLALAGLASWNDAWLHLTMLPFGLLLVWGVIRLARQLGADPIWAAALTVATSAFLISATNVMCDIMMLCLMVGSITLWISGLDRRNPFLLVAAGILGGLSALTKYFGISIIPLLAAYTLIRNGRELLSLLQARGRSATAGALWRILGPLLILLIPVAMLAVWHFWSIHLYGTSHIFGAAHYAQLFNGFGLGNFYALLSFLGACLVWPLVLVITTCGFRGRLVVGVGALFGAVALSLLAGRTSGGAVSGASLALGAVWVAAGVAFLYLAAERFMDRWREPTTWLLAMWIAGTIVFAAIINWTVAARNILPAVPPLALLAAMPLERRQPAAGSALLNWKAMAAAASVGLVVALVITWADFSWANHYRATARRLLARYGTEGRRIYFEGHWGFQYYMMKGGAIPFDGSRENLATTRDGTLVVRGMRAGDVLVIPINNYRLYLLGTDKWHSLEVTRDRCAGGIYLTRIAHDESSVTDPVRGAGFHSHTLGVLPVNYLPGAPDEIRVLAPAVVAADSGATHGSIASPPR